MKYIVKFNQNSHRLLKIFLFTSMVLLYSCQTLLKLDLTKDSEKDDLHKYDWYIYFAAPDEDAFIAVQRIAAPYIKQKNWEEASNVYKKYMPKFPNMKTRFEKILDLLKAPSQNLKIEKLPLEINNPNFSNYSPVISTDKKRIFLCRAKHEEYPFDEDIYYSDKINGKWSEAIVLPNHINKNGNQAPAFNTIDGNCLYFFNGVDRFSIWKIPLALFSIIYTGRFNSDVNIAKISYSFKTKADMGDLWSDYQSLPYPIETRFWQDVTSITNDGKAIFLSSDRPGGIGDYYPKDQSYHGGNWGNIDIYVSLKDDDGNWGEPINLGPTINTPYADKDPVLHPDGKTLFFVSDGHYGLGNLDIFYSKRLSDTSWTEWSEPVNLGKDINSSEDDWGYNISIDGDEAYFAKEENKKDDIYSISFPKVTDAFATIKGIVTDESGNKLSAHVQWKSIDSAKANGELTTNPNTGSYFAILQLGQKWVLFVDKEGYYPYSREIDLTNIKASTEIIQDVVLKQAPNAIVHGVITDQHKTPLEATVTCTDLETGQIIKKSESTSDGKYSVTIPLGRNYSFSYDKKDYIPDSKNFNLKKATSAQDITQDIILYSLESAIASEKSFIINNIFFDFDSDKLKTESFFELNNLIKIFKEYPNNRIKILGHTDSVGTDEYNLKLSDRRASSVKNYLVSKGIKSSNLESEGFGETKFIAPNDTDEGRAKNRRVEFLFLKKE